VRDARIPSSGGDWIGLNSSFVNRELCICGEMSAFKRTQRLDQIEKFKKSKCSDTNAENKDIATLERYSNLTDSKRWKNAQSFLTREMINSHKKSSFLIFNDGCDTIASKSLKQIFENEDDEN
jgi:hypothetical protein